MRGNLCQISLERGRLVIGDSMEQHMHTHTHARTVNEAAQLCYTSFRITLHPSRVPVNDCSPSEGAAGLLKPSFEPSDDEQDFYCYSILCHVSLVRMCIMPFVTISSIVWSCCNYYSSGQCCSSVQNTIFQHALIFVLENNDFLQVHALL